MYVLLHASFILRQIAGYPLVCSRKWQCSSLSLQEFWGVILKIKWESVTTYLGVRSLQWLF